MCVYVCEHGGGIGKCYRKLCILAVREDIAPFNRHVIRRDSRRTGKVETPITHTPVAPCHTRVKKLYSHDTLVYCLAKGWQRPVVSCNSYSYTITFEQKRRSLGIRRGICVIA